MLALQGWGGGVGPAGARAAVPINKTVISSFLAVCLFSSSTSAQIYDSSDRGSHLHAISSDRVLQAVKEGWVGGCHQSCTHLVDKVL